MGTTLSDARLQQMGVPQGSILSVTLFNLKINNVVKAVNPGVECSLYVDDFLVCFRSKQMRTIERQLQQCLNNLQKWSDENGFKFSKTKTKCMHFCQARKHHLDPDLNLDGSRIEVVDEHKFLGLYFDRKLSFIPHIKYLKAKCYKALNLLKVVAHNDWGADRDVLLRLYRALIRSKLDYGSIVYGSARKSYLQMLDPIHHQGLRLALGAFRTSPVNSLYAEANEPSLHLRREKLSLQYALKLSSNPSNPAFDRVFNMDSKLLFDKKPTAIRPFGLRTIPLLQELGINTEKIALYEIPKTPPWKLKTPEILYNLCCYKKSDTDPSIFKSRFGEIRNCYPLFTQIYTDGSKDGEKAAAAAVCEDVELSFRLPDNSSIFSAELKAIDLAFDYIEKSKDDKFIILSDSLSSLQAMDNLKYENPVVLQLLERFQKLDETNRIIFCWLPSHMGIRGNERVDRLAKSALTNGVSDFKILFSDFKTCIRKHITKSWQVSWDADLFNKLRSVKPVLGESHSVQNLNRREEVVMARCRIGHTRFTHSYLLNGEEPPECTACVEQVTVKHILLDCIDFAPTRQRYYSAANMKELFDLVNLTEIVNFLKEIKIYNRL